jgi:MbtH protein
MTNTFDEAQGTFLVLANGEGQHCIWPSYAAVPAGWVSMREPSSRAEAIAYVERSWLDVRHRSLVELRP